MIAKPAWLTTAFAEGVVELAPPRPAPAYKGALGRCWLAQHDPRRRPCSGPFERFHFISRQRVEDTVARQLPTGCRCPVCEGTGDDPIFEGQLCSNCGGGGRIPLQREDFVLLAAWDPRNGGVGCEGHHRRYDSHLTPALDLRYEHLPGHVVQFAFDWGVDCLLDRFPCEI